MEDLADVTAVILAGGLGSRLRSVVFDRPKVLAEVGGRPFLAYVLEQIAAGGIRRAVLCTGYLGAQVRGVFGNQFKGLRLSYSQECFPRGTAGAVRAALRLLKSDSVLVMNGDSFCEVNLRSFWPWHLARGGEGSFLLTATTDAGRFGRVGFDADERIVSFHEKEGHTGSACINAGVYFFKRSLLETIPQSGAVSFEREMFPAWVGRGLYGYRSTGRFVDIGTPEAYAQAEEFFRGRSLGTKNADNSRSFSSEECHAGGAGSEG